MLGYKQARRRDDDISLVNAGLWVRFQPGSAEVLSGRLAFGGMGPTTRLAPHTQQVRRSKVKGLVQQLCQIKFPYTNKLHLSSSGLAG